MPLTDEDKQVIAEPVWESFTRNRPDDGNVREIVPPGRTVQVAAAAAAVIPALAATAATRRRACRLLTGA
jgi:hypothetical protein